MPNDHARLSPSGASKWMQCPASLAAERGIADSRSEHAAQGTAAHSVAEMVLRALNPIWVKTRPEFSRTSAADFVGQTLDNWLITEDMAEPIQRYIDTVLEIARGNVLHVEQRVDFSHIVGVANSFGTADAVVICGDELQIHDLKFGMGVRVDAENNPQLMIYALGALRMFELGTEFSTVRLFIHQPRLNHVSEWSISVQKLNIFAQEVSKAATLAIKLYDAAMAGKSPAPKYFKPGDKQCRWCRAAPICKAYSDRVHQLVFKEFEAFDAGDPTLLNDADLLEVHGNIELIQAWCEKVKAHVYQRLLDGNKLHGLKLVKGRDGPRKWSNYEAAESVLINLLDAEHVYTAPSLISPTQAEKILRTIPDAMADLTPFITRATGAPSVAPETDPRPEYSRCSADEFTDLQ